MCIRDRNKTYRVTSDIQTGAHMGMITLDAHLMSLYARGMITAESLIEKSQSPDEMRKKVREMAAPTPTKAS